MCIEFHWWLHRGFYVIDNGVGRKKATIKSRSTKGCVEPIRGKPTVGKLPYADSLVPACCLPPRQCILCDKYIPWMDASRGCICALFQAEHKY
jgi:hypothetical protein